ncbi:MAG: histidinol-phosphate transaminase [Synergistaceae bacterium]|jgi:histidinol-phosphate aminotransferase|nr:histidinol-phosphate transaminase [Synergistaceae bacterium]
MKDIYSLARRDLGDVEPYRPAPLADGIKLDANESPWNLPENIRRKLTRWLDDTENLNRYPDTGSTALRGSIARHWGVTPSNVACGVGSDQLIDMICRVFLEPGDRVATFEPTFGMYAVTARLNHGGAVSVPVGYETSSARELLAAAADSDAKIIFVCSPNNPTGRAMSDDAVRHILENAECVVVLDEAYADFKGTSFVGRIAEFPNAIVIRTFSKAYGLAGIRVGYAIADERAIDLINTARPPFNIPTVSQLLAEWAMDEADEYAARAKSLAGARGRLIETLAPIDWFDAEPSDANFVLLTSRFDIAPLLEAGGVRARDFGVRDGIRRVRLTVGTDEENKKVGDLLCAARPK